MERQDRGRGELSKPSGSKVSEHLIAAHSGGCGVCGVLAHGRGLRGGAVADLGFQSAANDFPHGCQHQRDLYRIFFLLLWAQ
jgi:hypothetical protein